jgi:hypothetical protein
MEEILTKYSDYIVFVPASLLAIVIAYWTYEKQKIRKKLLVNVLEIVNLKNSNVIDDKLEFIYNQKSISEPIFWILRIENNGNSPIEKADFDTSLEISFKDETKIVSADIIQKEPNDVNIDLQIEEQKLTIKPMLLNQKDWFKIKIITEGRGMINATGRIKGIKKIEINFGELERVLFHWSIPLILSIVMFFALNSAFVDKDIPDIFRLSFMFSGILWFTIEFIRKHGKKLPK